MMALALKKKKEDEEAKLAEVTKEKQSLSSNQPEVIPEPHPEEEKPSDAQNEPDERGRRIDKGKAKVRVVGFDGTIQPEEDE